MLVFMARTIRWLAFHTVTRALFCTSTFLNCLLRCDFFFKFVVLWDLRVLTILKTLSCIEHTQAARF